MYSISICQQTCQEQVHAFMSISCESCVHISANTCLLCPFLTLRLKLQPYCRIQIFIIVILLLIIIMIDTHSHTIVLRPFFWNHPGELVPEEIRRFLVDSCSAREDDTGRNTDHPSGWHSIRTNPAQPPSPPHFTPDSLPVATLPLYPGLGQAPNMLACIPSGMVIMIDSV